VESEGSIICQVSCSKTLRDRRSLTPSSEFNFVSMLKLLSMLVLQCRIVMYWRHHCLCSIFLPLLNTMPPSSAPLHTETRVWVCSKPLTTLCPSRDPVLQKCHHLLLQAVCRSCWVPVQHQTKTLAVFYQNPSPPSHYWRRHHVAAPTAAQVNKMPDELSDLLQSVVI
jgi:hypothetical protein